MSEDGGEAPEVGPVLTAWDRIVVGLLNKLLANHRRSWNSFLRIMRVQVVRDAHNADYMVRRSALIEERMLRHSARIELELYHRLFWTWEDEGQFQ